MATFDEPITSRYLAYLDQWREHRGFRLEERVSVFFAWLLPHVIQVEANVGSTNLIVIPEFPLYHGAIKEGGDETFRYDAVDFAVFAPMEKRAFLVELEDGYGILYRRPANYLGKGTKKLECVDRVDCETLPKWADHASQITRAHRQFGTGWTHFARKARYQI